MAISGVPERMRAIVQDHYGSADVLRLSEVNVPIPDETSVLVKVRAASINAVDWRTMSGKPFIGRLLFFGLTRPKRAVRGVDVSGVVVTVRAKDSSLKPGDEVFGLGSGSFAEYVAADVAEIVPKPPEIPFDLAATLGVAAVTALQALRDVGKVRPQQSVLVLAAGSGVGSFAVQLAKWMGARVTGVTSGRNVELVRSLGADRVLDYSKEDFTQATEQFDCILDPSGLYSLRACRRRLTPNGVHVVVGARGGIGRFLKVGLLGSLGNKRVLGMIAKVKVEDLRLLGELTAKGIIRPAIQQRFKLEETPVAMGLAERHAVSGKLVIAVS
jgi:NADPH:quinone reductase-like Zn-dependent oxidoreductase